MRFIPHSDKEKEEMLKEAGVATINELFKDIPKEVFLKEELGIGKGLSEIELKKHIEELAAKSKSAKQLKLFLGAGCYNHFIPSTVSAITGRSEFYTAYTPYQPEISQGMLQAIYEWQSYICMLTEMDLANASMYDGASATAEAMMMAVHATKRKKVLFAKELNPEYRAVLQTYANSSNLELKEVALEELEKEIGDNTACLIVQNPNYLGKVEELKAISEQVQGKGAALVVAIAEALSLGFLDTPGNYGADIVAMDVQSFGNPMGFGGPAAGVIACKDKFKRHIPGRLVGKTVDSEGKEGFVLTLQAREQHIRREKASCNICSNQALCALAATVYLATVGEKGLKEIAKQNNENAKYLAEKLNGTDIELETENFFNEFVVKTQGAKQLQEKLLKKGFVFGYALDEERVLVTATELNSKDEIDELIEAIGELK